MKKMQLTPLGKSFVKKVEAYRLTKLDVSKPYKATPAIRPSAPKPPTARIATRKGADMQPGKPLPRDTRDAIRKDYLFGTESNEELADKYGIHPNTVYNLSERENWEELKEMLALNTQIITLGEKLITVIRERMIAPQVSEASIDEAPLPQDEEMEEEEDVEVPYTLDERVAEELVEEEVEEAEEPDDASLKWSF